jgi:hypothetical protein
MSNIEQMLLDVSEKAMIGFAVDVLKQMLSNVIDWPEDVYLSIREYREILQETISILKAKNEKPQKSGD